MLKIHINEDRCRKCINTEIEREREIQINIQSYWSISKINACKGCDEKHIDYFIWHRALVYN